MGNWRRIKAMEDKEALKKAIFEKLSPRRKKFIQKIGYEKWDPFQEPKDPSIIRKDFTKRTAAELFRSFFAENYGEDKVSNAYKQGVMEMCMGIINRNDKIKGMFEFSLWYAKLLEKENKIWEED